MGHSLCVRLSLGDIFTRIYNFILVNDEVVFTDYYLLSPSTLTIFFSFLYYNGPNTPSYVALG